VLAIKGKTSSIAPRPTIFEREEIEMIEILVAMGLCAIVLIPTWRSIMSAIDDLNAAVAANTAEVSTVVAAVKAMTTEISGLTAQIAAANAASAAPDATIEAAATAINASTAALAAALPVAPPPPAAA
jgi:septal ring factor EnvC (AmiA/AmiB activator)